MKRYGFTSPPRWTALNANFTWEKVDGEEQISGLFFYKAVLRTRDDAIDFSQLLGKSVAVHMECMDGTNTRFSTALSAV